MSDTENIEEYLNNIVGELSKLNKHLAKGYRVRCDKCGDELYVSKKMVAEDIGDYPSNWYFEWQKTHKELANPAFDCECSGIVELFEEEVWGE